MMTHLKFKTQVLVEPGARFKIAQLDQTLEALLKRNRLDIPEQPGRDVQIWPIRELPPKKGLSTREGQARLLHDLASIELQAMELAVRSLSEFPEAPSLFREELAEVAREEGQHFELCLNALEDLGSPWGTFPTHTSLWHSVAASDTLLDRLVIVHRYLEGSGLDASTKLLLRLKGVSAPEIKRAVEVIGRDEVNHVRFGSRWYHALVREAGLDPQEDFKTRLESLFRRVPRRLEVINRPLRLAVGFTEEELKILESIQRLSQNCSPG